MPYWLRVDALLQAGANPFHRTSIGLYPVEWLLLRQRGDWRVGACVGVGDRQWVCSAAQAVGLYGWRGGCDGIAHPQRL